MGGFEGKGRQIPGKRQKAGKVSPDPHSSMSKNGDRCTATAKHGKTYQNLF